jgi:hypothetical protein
MPNRSITERLLEEEHQNTTERADIEADREATAEEAQMEEARLLDEIEGRLETEIPQFEADFNITFDEAIRNAAGHIIGIDTQPDTGIRWESGSGRINTGGTFQLVNLGDIRPTRRGAQLPTSDDIPQPMGLPEDESDDPKDAVAYFERMYQKKYGKMILRTPKEEKKVELPAPEPVNESEEIIINYNELADTLATQQMSAKYGETWLDKPDVDNEIQTEYANLIESYEKIILNHKRKVDA